MEEIVFPNICAWCGSENIVKTKKISFHSEFATYSFELPICRYCSQLVRNMSQNEIFISVFSVFFGIALLLALANLVAENISGMLHIDLAEVYIFSLPLGLVVGAGGIQRFLLILYRDYCYGKNRSDRFIGRIIPATVTEILPSFFNPRMLSYYIFRFHNAEFSFAFNSKYPNGIPAHWVANPKYVKVGSSLDAILIWVDAVTTFLGIGAAAIVSVPFLISTVLVLLIFFLIKRRTNNLNEKQERILIFGLIIVGFILPCIALYIIFTR